MQTGASMSQTALVDQIIGSSEAIQFVDPVVRLYQAAFGRVPDQQGLSYNVNQLHSSSLVDVAQTFVSSPEFLNRYGTTAVTDKLVAELYHNVLGRGGVSSEISYWTHNGLSAAQVVAAISDSAEHKQIANAGINQFLLAAATGNGSYTGGLSQHNSTIEEDQLIIATTGMSTPASDLHHFV